MRLQDAATDTLPSKADFQEMRTDWLILEKERLERAGTAEDTGPVDTAVNSEMLHEIKTELYRRKAGKEYTEPRDFAHTEIAHESHR